MMVLWRQIKTVIIMIILIIIIKFIYDIRGASTILILVYYIMDFRP
jgi:hypothetical protein